MNHPIHFLDSVVTGSVSSNCIVRASGESTYKSEKQVRARLLTKLRVRTDGRLPCFCEESWVWTVLSRAVTLKGRDTQGMGHRVGGCFKWGKAFGQQHRPENNCHDRSEGIRGIQEADLQSWLADLGALHWLLPVTSV